MTEERRFALLRHYWQIPKTDSQYGLFWPDKAFEAMFNARNGWSLAGYWQRCTFDLLRPVFDHYGLMSGGSTGTPSRGSYHPGHIHRLARFLPRGRGAMLGPTGEEL